MKKRGTLVKLILIMMSLVIISLSVSAIFMRQYIKNRETDLINEKIQSTAKLIAQNKEVKDVVENKKQSDEFQENIEEAVKNSGVDFIVVMDTNFIRYSHPSKEEIGKLFSNIEDASATFTEGDHYSRQTGVLGEGTRFFTTIKDEEGKIIGIVCVGYTQKTVEAQLMKAQKNIYFVLFIGIGAAVILSFLYNKGLKRILLNQAPEEIAQSFVEKELISNHVSEGIIAVNTEKKLIIINNSAVELLNKVQNIESPKVGEILPAEIYNIFFDNILETKIASIDKQVILNHMDLLINRNPIFFNGKLYGAVVTLRDQSDMKQLITELSGTEKYNDTLREQSHNFMNKLHVLQGLIELKNYDEVKKYILYLKDDYHKKVGYISEKIQAPAVIGFLLTKSRITEENGVKFTIDKESSVPYNEGLESYYNDLVMILGILIDNSVEAVKDKKEKKIDIYLLLNLEEGVLICTVEDTGVGIKKEDYDAIFRRGYSTKGENRGYGLEAVANIVDNYGGLIEINSKLDIGTKITIELPILEEKNESINSRR